MSRNIVFVFIFILVSCTGRHAMPSLYPTSIEKTIKRFNYCMNYIHKMEIFQTMDHILTGSARHDYSELIKLLYLAGIVKPTTIKKIDDPKGSTPQSISNTTPGIIPMPTAPTPTTSTPTTGPTETSVTSSPTMTGTSLPSSTTGSLGISTDSEMTALAQSLKNELFDYARFAKNLKIRVTNISVKEKTAEVVAYFFDMSLYWEEKWRISLVLEEELWKIAELKQLEPKIKKKKD